MKSLFLILLGTSLILAGLHFGSKSHSEDQVVHAFRQWKKDNNKNYDSASTESFRMQVFIQNFLEIEAHNTHSMDSHSLAINHLADLTHEEFKAQYLSAIPQKPKRVVELENVDYPASVNWVQKGAVTNVKDQGACGSCWAFSATGCLEGLNAVQGGTLTSYSPQCLVDCAWKQGNMGCGGGWMDQAFEYTETKGIATWDSYPYTAKDGICKQYTIAFQNTGYTDSKAGDQSSLLQFISTQPTSVAVDAQTWQFYSGGILKNCGQSLDHGVLAVGYDTAAGYYLVKNSWGPTWGEKGYIQLAIGNTCGILNSASNASKN